MKKNLLYILWVSMLMLFFLGSAKAHKLLFTYASEGKYEMIREALATRQIKTTAGGTTPIDLSLVDRDTRESFYQRVFNTIVKNTKANKNTEEELALFGQLMDHFPGELSREVFWDVTGNVDLKGQNLLLALLASPLDSDQIRPWVAKLLTHMSPLGFFQIDNEGRSLPNLLEIRFPAYYGKIRNSLLRKDYSGQVIDTFGGLMTFMREPFRDHLRPEGITPREVFFCPRPVPEGGLETWPTGEWLSFREPQILSVDEAFGDEELGPLLEDPVDENRFARIRRMGEGLTLFNEMTLGKHDKSRISRSASIKELGLNLGLPMALVYLDLVVGASVFMHEVLGHLVLGSAPFCHVPPLIDGTTFQLDAVENWKSNPLDALRLKDARGDGLAGWAYPCYNQTPSGPVYEIWGRNQTYAWRSLSGSLPSFYLSPLLMHTGAPFHGGFASMYGVLSHIIASTYSWSTLGKSSGAIAAMNPSHDFANFAQRMGDPMGVPISSVATETALLYTAIPLGLGLVMGLNKDASRSSALSDSLAVTFFLQRALRDEDPVALRTLKEAIGDYPERERFEQALAQFHLVKAELRKIQSIVTRDNAERVKLALLIRRKNQTFEELFNYLNREMTFLNAHLLRHKDGPRRTPFKARELYGLTQNPMDHPVAQKVERGVGHLHSLSLWGESVLPLAQILNRGSHPGWETGLSLFQPVMSGVKMGMNLTTSLLDGWAWWKQGDRERADPHPLLGPAVLALDTMVNLCDAGELYCALKANEEMMKGDLPQNLEEALLRDRYFLGTFGFAGGSLVFSGLRNKLIGRNIRAALQGNPR